MILSNQQDKTFLQNVFLINPRPLKYLTDKSDEKQHKKNKKKHNFPPFLFCLFGSISIRLHVQFPTPRDLSDSA